MQSGATTVRRALNFYAWLVVGATLVLISIGGHVTTKGAGMAVPDWPLSFGQINPPGWWLMPAVRLEHGHRLVGAVIGLLTVCLAGWTFLVERDRFARRLVVLAVFGVILQGVLGGIRVNLNSTAFAVVHGCLAQAFLLLLAGCAMRLAWATRSDSTAQGALAAPRPGLRLLGYALPVVLFVELIVAAVMRHYQAGMAIPDFPLAFGRLIPPFASFEISIHFAHRVLALVILLGVLGACFAGPWRVRGVRSPLLWMVLLVAFQIGLGASVVLSGRQSILTTLHVVNGAGVLLASFMFAVRVRVASLRSLPAGESRVIIGETVHT